MSHGISLLRAAIDSANRFHPLPRCEHGAALADGGGELLEPPCGCRLNAPKFIFFDRVKEVVTGTKSVILIVPNDVAGSKHRYDVIVMRPTHGTVYTVGRELNLKIARKAAKEHAKL